MLGKAAWEIHLLMCSPLRWHSNASDLLHLRVVGRAYTIQVPSNLGPQISYADEFLQNVLRHDVGISRFLHIVSPIICIRSRRWYRHCKRFKINSQFRVPEIGDTKKYLYVLRIDIDVIHTEIEICCWYGPHTPICLGSKCSLLVWTCSGHNQLITMHIRGPCGNCCKLTCFFRLKHKNQISVLFEQKKKTLY